MQLYNLPWKILCEVMNVELKVLKPPLVANVTSAFQPICVLDWCQFVGQAELDNDEVYAQLTLLPESKVSDVFSCRTLLHLNLDMKRLNQHHLYIWPWCSSQRRMALVRRRCLMHLLLHLQGHVCTPSARHWQPLTPAHMVVSRCCDAMQMNAFHRWLACWIVNLMLPVRQL